MLLDEERSTHLMAKRSKRPLLKAGKRVSARKSEPQPAAGYSKRPLADKLGLKPDHSRAIIEAPEHFPALIGTDVFDRELELDEYDYLHFFTASQLALRHVFPVLAKRLKTSGMLWISWPKKSSGQRTDLGEDGIRAIGLANGLVDVKVCAIDETWSGLKFVYRLSDR